MQISGRNFLPEIFGEVHPETAPLQALCCALSSTEQSTFRGGEKGEKVPRKGEDKGWPSKEQKGKKDARKQVRQNPLVLIYALVTQQKVHMKDIFEGKYV